HGAIGADDTPDDDDALWIGNRQRPQQNAVDDAEHQGHGTNAQRQGQPGRGGERRRFPQRAARVANVSAQLVDSPASPRVADVLLDPDNVAKLYTCGSFSLYSRLPTLNTVGHGHSEMVRDLIIEVRVLPTSPARQPHPS